VKSILILFCLVASISLMAQDKIFLKSGDTLSVIISTRDNDRVTYTSYDDPELNTVSIPVDQVLKIQLNNGKVFNFKKTKHPRYYAGVFLGEAFPVSDFANKNVEDNRSGFAEQKSFVSFEGRMPLLRFIGLQADVSLGSFGVNSSTYFDYLRNQYSQSSQNISVSGSLSNYVYASFSVGPDLGFNLGRKFKLFIPIQFSVISLSTKDNDHIVYFNNATSNTHTVDRNSKGPGMGMAFGGKLDYIIGKHFGVGVAFKWNLYRADIKVTESYQGPLATTQNSYNWNQSVTYIYAGLNLHYHFK
jgi:hypothetical protein